MSTLLAREREVELRADGRQHAEAQGLFMERQSVLAEREGVRLRSNQLEDQRQQLERCV